MKKAVKKNKPKYNAFENTAFMLRLAWTSEEKKVIFLGILTSLLAVALNLINLYVAPTILAAVENKAEFSTLIVTILVFVGLLIVVSAASSYVAENIMFGRISVRTEIINMINKKSATTSYPNVFDDDFNKLLAKSYGCVNSNDAASEAIWTTLTDLLTNILGFVIYVLLLSFAEPLLILAVVVTTVISYFVSKRLNEYGYRHRDEQAEYEKHGWYIIDVSQRPEYAKDIKIFGLLPWINEVYRKAVNAYVAFHKKAEGVYVWGSILDLLLTFLRNALAYAFLIGSVIRNSITVSEFLLYFSAVSGFATWVTGILGGLNTLNKQSLDINTIREVLEFKEPFKFEEGLPLAIEKDKGYEIALNNVSFRYPGAEKDTLTNINLTLKIGEKLAVVGLNGAGKTTLIKLICGFLDPTEGKVTLNGEDIRQYNRNDYYKVFSAVFQSFLILPTTIAANVAQTEDGIDMNKVKQCVEKAGLTEKIESLPKGYDTFLRREIYDEAVLLSGGETQRLMLARALYKDAPIVILDEPTAALDPIAESRIYQKYDEMTNGKSSVYISHRLASTRFCDRIIMVDGGAIAEEGTHEQLLQKGGKYAELYQAQSKYYKEGGDVNEND